ncbi:hypothetical protein AU184_15535 [Mycolicibacterium novocastrense]|uniref:hypothetical protein n=1 Tax=Mycolicibacterium novocastrense TaxID=59813 RepID=UPI000749101B|nr:hypothetical protein [Mycolicibacterium novocastrense]KUH75792.1 hypothetical protein AU183_00555 [Mycolicibacterium novocastrense]KUH78353.1 hypothetical protein AU072_10615 [Mycolicibacterium novocastrense]KUH79688.1 hypothetical protein AU184_15535 [Mycolicibacterium novocastrense]
MTDVGGASASIGPVARGSVARVGTSTALTVICSYAVYCLAARDLSPERFALFGVFWGALGLVTGVAYGVLPETTREVRGARSVGLITGPRTHPLRTAALIGVVAAAVIAGSSPLWGPHVFSEERWLSVGLVSVGIAGFCGQAALLGALAGFDRWSQYGALMVADAVVRLSVAAAAVVMGWGLSGFLWAITSGAATWLVFLIVSPSARAVARQFTPGSVATFVRGAAHSITAAGASAMMLMGFPVLLKATSEELGAAGGVLILAVTLTRAPLLLPLNAMQGNLIAHFVDQRSEGLRCLLPPALVITGIGAVGIPMAGLAGPWLLRVGFGPDYYASGQLMAWLTAAAVVIAFLSLTGTAAIAASLHRAYSMGWVGATVASTFLLLLPLALDTRTVIALMCGPLVGIAIHLGALARALA